MGATANCPALLYFRCSELQKIVCILIRYCPMSKRIAKKQHHNHLGREGGRERVRGHRCTPAASRQAEERRPQKGTSVKMPIRIAFRRLISWIWFRHCRVVGPKVHLTGGNRSGLTGYWSNRTGPASEPAGIKPAITGHNSKFKFEFKKMKKSQKIPKSTTRCEESNDVKLSQKLVHLV